MEVRAQLRDIVRRVRRRPVRGGRIRARFLGAEVEVETDRDGYFRVEMEPGGPVPADRLWHRLELRMLAPEPIAAAAEVFIPPAQAKLVVVSDIDDTVMHTGVANKAAMLWRLFVQDAADRTVFPGVSHLYRALYAGASGHECNPMLYVSRAPWGIYDILETFFQRHDIPHGPILFLREWGISWRSPLPRRAEDHKRALIEAMMALYADMPFVLIGDWASTTRRSTSAWSRRTVPACARSTSAMWPRAGPSAPPRWRRCARRCAPPARTWCSPRTASPSPRTPAASA